MIKILYSNGKGSWRDSEEPHIKFKYLKEYIDELVDKENWIIIAATNEYIILKKRDYTELPSIEGTEEPDTPQ